MARTKKPSDILETDLAQKKMGDNQLQGDDQANVRNQRRDQPGAKRSADDVIETFRKTDKDERAKKDLGKGNRAGIPSPSRLRHAGGNSQRPDE